MSLGRVANKVALVTGAAKGIGAATARLLAAQGAKVVLTDVDDKEGKEVTNEITSKGFTASYANLDTSSEAAWKSVMNEIQEKYGGLNVLVNNAGILFMGGVEETTLEQFRKVQAVNVEGVFLGCKYAVEQMRKNNVKNGSIINLGSIEGKIGDPRLAAYNASKGAVRQLTKAVALEQAMKGTGIRVNNVCPGYIDTPLLRIMPEAEYTALVGLHPVGRLGLPEEVANMILFLASDECLFANGSSYFVDGLYTAQ